MLAVLAVQLAVDDVIDVAFVRHRDVFAADAVHVIVRVGAFRARGLAAERAGRLQFVFVDVAVVRVMQVPVVDVVDVVAVADRDVAAAGAVDVLVTVVDEKFHA